MALDRRQATATRQVNAVIRPGIVVDNHRSRDPLLAMSQAIESGAVRMFLISGVPGAGKTTVAHALASRFPRSAHIEGDLVGEQFIVNGLVPPQGPPEDEARTQLQLRRRNMCALADSFAEAGFVSVIDDVVVSVSVLDGYIAGLRSRPLLLVQLAPSLDVVRVRDSGRHKQVFEMWSHLDAEMRAAITPYGLWLDTSAMTAAETVGEILARRDEAIVAE